jgi:hypothetical protein
MAIRWPGNQKGAGFKDDESKQRSRRGTNRSYDRVREFHITGNLQGINMEYQLGLTSLHGTKVPGYLTGLKGAYLLFSSGENLKRNQTLDSRSRGSQVLSSHPRQR